MKNYLIITLLIGSLSFAQQLTLDTSQSKIKWTGKEITTKEHYGSLAFNNGTLTFKNNKPDKGNFVVDMTSLQNEDLSEDYRGRLEGHLKSDDFFSVDKFPEAMLNITQSTQNDQNNYSVEGLLTIKGATHPISFNMIKVNSIWEAKMVFDRAKYNVQFRSGSFFENLGDKLIYDDIVIETQLVFN